MTLPRARLLTHHLARDCAPNADQGLARSVAGSHSQLPLAADRSVATCRHSPGAGFGIGRMDHVSAVATSPPESLAAAVLHPPDGDRSGGIDGRGRLRAGYARATKVATSAASWARSRSKVARRAPWWRVSPTR